MTDPIPESLHDLNRESLLMVAIVAEHAVPAVAMHVRRIRGYAQILSDALGLEPAQAALIADACQLHDIGMASVPASIVRKTTNLTNEEWEIIRQHPEVGANLLRNGSHDLFRMAETIARTHHERWDGSGYPQGLRGENIPLGGRICGLCDVFDTLTHSRSYKQAFKPEQVLLLLQESSETFFDPRLVELFTLHFNDILKVRATFANPNPDLALP